MRALRATAAATAVLFASSCVTRYSIPPVQLQYLNGYSIHSEQTIGGQTYTETPYRLLTTEGTPVDYNSTKKLVLLGDAGQLLAPPGPFDTISIGEDSFDAVPLNGPAVGVPLEAITKVEIQQPDQVGTDIVISLVSLIVSLAITIPLASLAHDSSSATPSSASGAPKNAALK